MKWILGICVIGVIVGAAATVTVPAQTIAADEATLKLFPLETQGIAFVDAAALRNAPLVQEFLKTKGMPSLPQALDDLGKATGFKPERDVDKVTIARISRREVLAIIHARYDRFGVEQYLKEKNIASESYQGRTIYYPNHHGDDPGIALIDGVVVAGSDSAIRGAIQRYAAPGSNVLLNNELYDAVKTIEPGNQIWAAGEFEFDKMSLPARRPAQMDAYLKSFRRGTYQMRIDQDVHAKATGDFTDPENAQSITDLARGFLAIARLQLSRAPEMLQLLDGFRVQNSGPAVTVNFDARGDLVKKLHADRMH